MPGCSLQYGQRGVANEIALAAASLGFAADIEHVRWTMLRADCVNEFHPAQCVRSDSLRASPRSGSDRPGALQRADDPRDQRLDLSAMAI